MSIDQANAFRKYVDENETLQQQVLEGLQDDSLNLTALAKEHGFEVTAEEALGMLDQVDLDTDGGLELTDFELSLVAGGLKDPCNDAVMAGLAYKMSDVKRNRVREGR